MRNTKWSNARLRRELRASSDFDFWPEPIRNAFIEYVIYGGKSRQNEIQKRLAEYVAQRRRGRELRRARIERRASRRVQASRTRSSGQ